MGGMLAVSRARRRARSLRAYRDFIEQAPDEVGGGAGADHGAARGLRPRGGARQAGGRHRLLLRRAARGGRGGAAAAARGRPTRSLDMVQPMPYAALQQMLDAGNPHGIREYFKVDWLSELPDEAIDIIVEQAEQLPAPFGQLILGPMGGAVGAHGQQHAGAEHPRRAVGVLLPVDVDGPGRGRAQQRLGARVRGGDAARSGSARRYPNFIEPDEGVARLRASYGAEKYDAARRAEAQVGPGQPLPAEPEHRAWTCATTSATSPTSPSRGSSSRTSRRCCSTRRRSTTRSSCWPHTRGRSEST